MLLRQAFRVVACSLLCQRLLSDFVYRCNVLHGFSVVWTRRGGCGTSSGNANYYCKRAPSFQQFNELLLFANFATYVLTWLQLLLLLLLLICSGHGRGVFGIAIQGDGSLVATGYVRRMLPKLFMLVASDYLCIATSLSVILKHVLELCHNFDFMWQGYRRRWSRMGFAVRHDCASVGGSCQANHLR